MKRYKFYDHGRIVGEFNLLNKEEVETKASEIEYALSFGIRHPKVTYREIDDGKTKK